MSAEDGNPRGLDWWVRLMSLILDCRACGRKLRVPEELLGLPVQCPSCGGKFDAVAPSTETLPAVPVINPAPASPAADVQVKLTLDDEPPAPPREELAPLLHPAPPPPFERPRERDDPGPAYCPACGESVSPSAIRCRFCGARLDGLADRPWEGPGAYGVRRDCEPHRGTLVLTLGILGLVLSCLAPLGLALSIPAWVMGSSDLKKMRNGEMDPAGRSSTNGGYVCGIIGTVLQLLCGGVRFFAIVFSVLDRF